MSSSNVNPHLADHAAIAREHLAHMERPTVPGIGPGGWDSGTLAREQELHVADQQVAAEPASWADTRDIHVSAAPSVLYSLYTEDTGVLDRVITPYFDGATILHGTGIWQGALEPCAVIQVLGAPSDRVRILQLARAIIRTGQTSVLVTSLGPEGFASFTVGA